MKGLRIVINILGLALLSTLVVGLSRAQGTGPQSPQAPQVALGTAFTYQGQIDVDGSPLNGTCDLQFSLYDAASGGTQIGTTQTAGNVTVTNGLFTVLLDFGSGAFNGDARWLDIQARCPAESGDYTPLTPRQALTPTPYALALPGLYTQQNITSTNIVGGYRGNYVMPDVVGATIGGGGSEWASHYHRVTDDFGTIGGGDVNWAGNGNSISDDAAYATVCGGNNNTASGLQSTVAGGAANTASGQESAVGGGKWNIASNTWDTIGGGQGNLASGGGATVGGGGGNSAGGAAATIGGGDTNTTSGQWATIAGGRLNIASAIQATVGGGNVNVASGAGSTVGGGGGNIASGDGTAIGGGMGNVVSGTWATIGGGLDNIASGHRSAVGGGWNNLASGGIATIGGGYTNTASGNYATVPGGVSNTAAGNYGFAAGRRAGADHQGAFVWGDSTDADINSSGNDQFIVRANGGVWIGQGTSAMTPTIGAGVLISTSTGAYLSTDGVWTNASDHGTFWQVGGNSGITSGANFLGTTDAVSLTLGVSGTAALRLEPNATSPNVIGGNSGNSVTTGVYGATIAGGGTSGDTNRVTGNYGSVGGGFGNTAGNAWATIGGGHRNTASNVQTTVCGGNSNIASGGAATVCGGAGNTANGEHSFVGGGYLNTASGYQAAVGGGYDNTASGAESTVGGGYLNTASGENSTVGGGYNNTANSFVATVGGGAYNTAGFYGVVGGGYYNTASGSISIVGGGERNTASGGEATVGGGMSNTASGTFATIPGGGGAAATLFGQMAYASGTFTNTETGDAQTSVYVLRNTTTNATPALLYLDGLSSLLTLTVSRTLTFDILVVARSDAGASAGYQVRGVIENYSGATSFIGTPTVTTLGEDVAAWNVSVLADDTNDTLVVQVTGAASTTIRWVATVRTAEVAW